MKNSLQLFNIQLKINKCLVISLRKIFGINLHLATLICKKFGYNLNSKVNYLNIEDLKNIRKFILSNYVVQEQLKQRVSNNLNELIQIKSNRGLRHKLNLPVRGQRTKTNRKTKRNFR
jgi:small subunit ribosomal protein S13